MFAKAKQRLAGNTVVANSIEEVRAILDDVTLEVLPWPMTPPTKLNRYATGCGHCASGSPELPACQR